MDFRAYQHVERYGNEGVIGIEAGTCYIFPKIDGTNSQVYRRGDVLYAGSRSRELTLEKDNAGFYTAISKDQAVKGYILAHPEHRLCGEWLVSHSLKTYRQDAWRKFYIFDVCVDKEDGSLEYLPYDVYQPLLEEFGLNYIKPIKIIENGNYELFSKCLEENTFLIQDGKGIGEGVVIKNYNYTNKFGKQLWAKLITSEFRVKQAKETGADVVTSRLLEEDIVDEFVTTALVEKEYAKILNERGGWNSKLIPELLSRVFHALVEEEMWEIVKKFKNPTINFKTLNTFTVSKIKLELPQLF